VCCQAHSGEDLVREVKLNTKRYVTLISQAIDEALPEPNQQVWTISSSARMKHVSLRAHAQDHSHTWSNPTSFPLDCIVCSQGLARLEDMQKLCWHTNDLLFAIWQYEEEDVFDVMLNQRLQVHRGENDANAADIGIPADLRRRL
jgi:hypothetical protein